MRASQRNVVQMVFNCSQVICSPHNLSEPTPHLQIAFVEPQHEKLKGSHGEMAVADWASFAAGK